jgi:anti-sigma B factor antagonist
MGQGECLMAGLLISVTKLPTGDGVCSVMRLAGEADLSATELRDALAAELAGSPRLLLLDMSAMTFIDSGATQMIVAAYRVAGAGRAALALLRPSDPVARVLGLMGVDQLIGVYGSVDEAVAAARPLAWSDAVYHGDRG